MEKGIEEVLRIIANTPELAEIGEKWIAYKYWELGAIAGLIILTLICLVVLFNSLKA